mgnify:CR=1 FL=1
MFTKNAKYFTRILDQDKPHVRNSTYVAKYPSIKEANILPMNFFVNEVSDMYGLTTYFNHNGRWFKRYSEEAHYMYACVFKELLMKVPMVPAHRNVRPPQGKNEWILCGMIAAKYGAKKLF